MWMILDISITSEDNRVDTTAVCHAVMRALDVLLLLLLIAMTQMSAVAARTYDRVSIHSIHRVMENGARSAELTRRRGRLHVDAWNKRARRTPLSTIETYCYLPLTPDLERFGTHGRRKDTASTADRCED